MKAVEKIKIYILGLILGILIVMCIDYSWHMVNHKEVNPKKYTVQCIEGYEYIIMHNSYQGYMSPKYIHGVPVECGE